MIDWPEIISTLLLVAFYAAIHFAPASFKKRVRTEVRHGLGPLAERLFPWTKKVPWLFEPIAAADLPPAQRHHFETHSIAFIARGWTPLGDFVMRRDPA